MQTEVNKVSGIKQKIPWMMAGVRAGLGPVLVAGAACGWSPLGLAAMVVTALVSDIFDGVLARRWRCDSASARLFDSMADTVFYLCTAVALWRMRPELWRENGVLLAMLLALEAMRFGFDFAKFGKPASYHSLLAKAWGLVLAVAVTATFAMGRTSGLVPVALWLGIACNLEGLAMSLVLPVWRRDVLTLDVAFALRGELLRQLEFERRMQRVRAGQPAAGLGSVSVGQGGTV